MCSPAVTSVPGWMVVGADVPHCYGAHYSGQIRQRVVGSEQANGLRLSCARDI